MVDELTRIEKYQRAFKAGVAKRQEMLAEFDAKLDMLAEAMIRTDGTNADEETDLYLLLRNTKEQTNGYQTKRDETLKGYIEKVGNRLLRRLNDQGVKSMRAASGTFYKEKVDRPSCADWPTLYKWIAENDMFEMLEKRLTKKVVTDYLTANEKLPPGINLNSVFEARVRKGNEA